MVLNAHVLINTEKGFENEVLGRLRKEHVEAYRVRCAYDIVVKIQAESLDALNEKVTGVNGIRNISGIRGTQTLISYM